MDHGFYSDIEDQDFNVRLKVLGICSINREEWIVTDLAANLLGITTVPLYETLGADMLTLILNQTQMTTMFGSEKSLTNIITIGAAKGELNHLKQLICFDQASEGLRKLCEEHGLHLHNYHDAINY